MASEGTPLTILVAFATANTGSKVVEYLSKSKDKVAIKGLVRNPDKPEAQALAGLPNVTLVKGEIENDAALKEALKGVSRAFLVTGPGEDSQYDREVTFIKAATEAGVEAIVRISTANCLMSVTTTNVYARAHAKIEEYIEKHKLPVVDLRPNWYMSNWLSSAGEIKGLKRLSFPIKPDNLDKQKFAMVDTRDVAGAAAAILLLPSDHLAKFLEARAIEVHGPQEVSFADKLKAIEKAIGHQIEYSYVEPEKWAEALQGFGMSKEFANSFLSTVLIVGGEKEPKRPYVQKSSALLLDVYKPKYTVQDWAKDNKEAFA